MRIFIDIGHPAHVHYFRNFIKIMQNRGHDFLISARNKEVSHTLLERYNITFFDRGRGSNNLLGKVAYGIKADIVLYKKAKSFKPDLFLSFASPYAAHISKIMRKPNIAFTDTENASLGILSFAPLTQCIITPTSFLSDFGSKHIRFNGFMELCYLHPNYFTPDRNNLDELKLIGNEPYVLLRFVSWGANHDFGQSGIPDQCKIKLVKELSHIMRVFISAEGEIPSELLEYKIQISPEKMHEVLAFATIYIGEGATMASECAMLGTPAIYVNTLTSGTLDRQESYGLLFGFRGSNHLFEKAIDLVNFPDLKKEWQRRRQKMLTEQIDVTSFMIWFIENYPESGRIMKENPLSISSFT